jgi:transketolase C-terminal domain/subunit
VGEVAGEVLAAHQQLGADGIRPAVYQFHTVKPLDTATLDRLAAEVEHLVVVEEHSPQGGLFSAVAGWAATAVKRPRITRLGAPDAFALGNLTREGFRRQFGFDAAAIASACRQLVH